MKKILATFFLFTLLIISSLSVYATNREDQDVILDSVIFENTNDTSKLESRESGMTSRSVDPGYGSVKIDDVLKKTSGWSTSDTAHFTTYELSKDALIKVIKKVPGIGDVYSRGESIYNDLKKVYSIMRYIDTEGETEYVTKYSYRNFYHKLSVWDYNNSWYDAGYSLSRYFYKSQTMYYIDIYGEAHTKTKDFTYSNGYDPAEIADAPHYMDKSYLADKAVYSWNHKPSRFVETY